uniref:Nascent polypeptide-associated complex subunit alpha-like UBA domain-containing protein n=1 Tax=Hyaloperonospora arabidopsidis (strain Emoy2) TaxID=559515 RepID=M4B5V4_HYAAE
MSQTKDTTKQQAAADAGSDDEEPQTQKVKSDKDENNAMAKLTDLVEEKQMDENKMKLAFQALCKQEEANKEAERLLEKKLAAVKVGKDDVALVAQEMEISMQQADRKLREADGDVVKCLHALIAA